MKNLLHKYIHGSEHERIAIESKLKTDEMKRVRRQTEDRIRKEPLDFLKACAALDIKQLGGE